MECVDERYRVYIHIATLYTVHDAPLQEFLLSIAPPLQSTTFQYIELPKLVPKFGMRHELYGHRRDHLLA